jgi:hypothetical protein
MEEHVMSYMSGTCACMRLLRWETSLIKLFERLSSTAGTDVFGCTSGRPRASMRGYAAFGRVAGSRYSHGHLLLLKWGVGRARLAFACW